jgi:hypothetical protein
MPATRSITNLPATVTQSALVNAIQTAFTNAGFSAPVLDTTSGTDRILAYSFTTSTGNFSTSHIRIRITSALAIFQQLSTGIPSGGTSGANSSAEISLGTLTTTTPCIFNALNGGSEYRLILLTQGTVLFPLGVIAPSTRRSSWSLNSWSWAFLFTTSAMSTLRGTNLNQFASTDYDLLGMTSARMGTANPIDNERDIVTNLLLLTQSNQGIVGRTSDNFAFGSFNGSSRYDTINITGTSQQYLVVVPGSGGLAIRIA